MRSHYGRPTLCLTTRYGDFKLNKQAAETLGLAAGDRVAIVQDGKNPENWYLTRDDKGYRLRPHTHGCLLFSNKPVKMFLMEFFELEQGKTYTFRLASQPEVFKNRKHYGILVKA